MWSGTPPLGGSPDRTPASARVVLPVGMTATRDAVLSESQL